MKGCLNSVVTLQDKYVELPEFKKHSCVNINKAVPKFKVTETEQEEGLSDTRAHTKLICKRKRRRFKHSFFYSDNLIVWTNDELNRVDPKNLYSGSTLSHYEAMEKKMVQKAQAVLIKSDAMMGTPANNSSPEKQGRYINYLGGGNAHEGNAGTYGAGQAGMSPLQGNQPGAKVIQGQFSSNSTQSRYLNNISENYTKVQTSRRKVQLKNQPAGQGNPNQPNTQGGRKGTVGNHMDILKKFRYNFHYWLRNCYQAEDNNGNPI